MATVTGTSIIGVIASCSAVAEIVTSFPSLVIISEITGVEVDRAGVEVDDSSAVEVETSNVDVASFFEADESVEVAVGDDKVASGDGVAVGSAVGGVVVATVEVPCPPPDDPEEKPNPPPPFDEPESPCDVEVASPDAPEVVEVAVDDEVEVASSFEDGFVAGVEVEVDDGVESGVVEA